MEKVKVKIKALEGAEIPKYGTEQAAGFDFKAHNFKVMYKGKKEIDLTKNLQHSISEGYITLRPFERVLIGTGLSMEIPDGYEIQVRPRSGLALKSGVTVLNAPGTIDSDYRGEVGVILHNTCQYLCEIRLGDRIAQGILAKCEQADFETEEELSETERGAGGFGSTGK